MVDVRVWLLLLIEPFAVWFIVVSDVQLTNHTISYSFLQCFFRFESVQTLMIDKCSIYPLGPYLSAIPSSVSELVDQFQFLNRSHLQSLSLTHGLILGPCDWHSSMVNAIQHHMVCCCLSVPLLFHSIPQPHHDVQMVNVCVKCSACHSQDPDHSWQVDLLWSFPVQNSDPTAHSASNQLPDEGHFLYLNHDSWNEKLEIISEWQTTMEPSGFAKGTCAVCGWSTPHQQLHLLSPSWEMLQMLQNNCLLVHVLPDAYNVELYEGAILCFHRMTSLEVIGPLCVCHTCHSSLQSSPPWQPRYVLANFLYYGTEKIPEDVRDAFATASPFDLCLVSCCCSSLLLITSYEVELEWATSPKKLAKASVEEMWQSSPKTPCNYELSFLHQGMTSVTLSASYFPDVDKRRQ